jgi:hypothetical protein
MTSFHVLRELGRGQVGIVEGGRDLKQADCWS